MSKIAYQITSYLHGTQGQETNQEFICSFNYSTTHIEKGIFFLCSSKNFLFSSLNAIPDTKSKIIAQK